MKENLLFRHRAYQIIRKFFVENGFVEGGDALLTKSTPEGAGTFIVPFSCIR
jgi:aspartyl-tRNA synthetase (EC 6.1.1.12)